MIIRKKLKYGITLMLIAFVLNGCSALSREGVNLNSPRTDNQEKTIVEKTHQEPVLEKKPGVLEPTGVDLKKTVITDVQLEKKLYPRKQSINPANKERKVPDLNSHLFTEKKKNGDFVFNFDDADLYEVIRTFAEILKWDYIVEDDITGSVTVHTAGGLTRDDVYPVFFQILEANGLTAVKEENFYRIINIKDALKLPLRMHMNADMADVPPGERMIIQIISLDHIDVSEMVKIIQPFVSAQGTIITHDKADTILLVDKGISVLKALNLVKVFDVDTFQQKNHRFYPVKYMDADKAVDLLKQLLKAYGKSEEKIEILPLKRLNVIIAVSGHAEFFDWISTMLGEIDIPGYDTEPKIYIYKVKNGNCEDIGGVLETVFSSGSGDEKTEAEKRGVALEEKSESETMNPIKTGSIKSPNEKMPRQNLSTNLDSSGAETLKGEISIVQDKTRNALIIKALPADYKIVEKVLKELDILPRQVLIEVKIVDFTLTDKDELGVDWSYLKGGIYENGSLMGNGIISGELNKSGSFGLKIGISDNWKATVAAMASENKANVLSSPVVLASDNKPASISVAQDIPTVSTVYNSTGDSNVTETNVQYRKTGIILSVTPHINDRGLVTMEINQEVSDVGAGVEAGGETYPSFKTRSVQTEFTVAHNQTIVIGGLMTKTEDKDNNGVHYLASIPAFGWLFGQKKDNSTKTELAIFITPHVIYSLEDVDSVTSEFQRRIKDIDLSYQKQ